MCQRQWMPRFIRGKAKFVFSVFYLSSRSAKLLSAVLCNQQKGYHIPIAGLAITTTSRNTMHHSHSKMETSSHICREEEVQSPPTAADAVNNSKSPHLCAVSPFLHQKIRNLRKNWILLKCSLHIHHTSTHYIHPCGIMEIFMMKIIQKTHVTNGQKMLQAQMKKTGATQTRHNVRIYVKIAELI